MLRYYFGLALRSLRQNVVLTGFIVAAVGLGVGSSMTLYSVLRSMSGDPIPSRSSRLFTVTLDNWGPGTPADPLQADQLAYRDATALAQSGKAARATAMYGVQFVAQADEAGDAKPLNVSGRAASSDFFHMFQPPFRAGAAWTRSEDADRARVVVLGDKAAARLFPAVDPVGRSLFLDGVAYRVVGVLGAWDFQPRAYDLTTRLYSNTEDVFLPFTTAIEQQVASAGSMYCPGQRPVVWAEILSSECRWLQFWAELPTPEAVSGFRSYLASFASGQVQAGRFSWPARPRLHDLREWLVMENMVPGEVKISTAAAFGFLFVCLLNAVALMLARFATWRHALSVRRALGATRLQVFGQCMAETAVVGLVGGAVGLALTALGLSIQRQMLREDYVQFADLNASVVVITLATALVATLATGIYPAWRASRFAIMSQLRVQ